jgi:hypothetical protein
LLVVGRGSEGSLEEGPEGWSRGGDYGYVYFDLGEEEDLLTSIMCMGL